MGRRDDGKRGGRPSQPLTARPVPQDKRKHGREKLISGDSQPPDSWMCGRPALHVRATSGIVTVLRYNSDGKSSGIAAVMQGSRAGRAHRVECERL